MKHKTNILLVFIIVTVIMVGMATALPEMLDVFNAKYNTYHSRLDTCDICHSHGLQNTANLNSYGMALKGNLNIEVNKALSVIEPLDSDGDGFTNIEEIRNLTFPGNKSDYPMRIVTSSNNRINRTTDNNENNATVTTNLTPTVIATTQKIPGFGIVASILSLFILSKCFISKCRKHK